MVELIDTLDFDSRLLIKGLNPFSPATNGLARVQYSSLAQSAERRIVYLTLLNFVKDKMNSKKKGNITELETMLAFMKLGYNVLTPYGDCERYDFVVDVNGKLLKMQSKTSHSEDNGASFIFNGRSNHRKEGKIVYHQYTGDEIDYFVTFFNDKCYVIPVDECGKDKRLRLLPPKNNQTRGINWAKDYELEEVAKNW